MASTVALDALHTQKNDMRICVQSCLPTCQIIKPHLGIIRGPPGPADARMAVRRPSSHECGNDRYP